MTIDSNADRPVYKQLADLIRAQIHAGVLRPGQRLAAENDYAAEHGISRDSVRRAMAVLRGEGLIVTELRGSRVRETEESVVVQISSGVTITTRMPTEPERKKLGIGEGTPVLLVTDTDGETRLLAGDRTVLQVSDAE
ncbi:GntR family transcriptional regulator [Streptosporangium sp. KLBMP 9127]|nr:GntR family transcriptional regulator [Streptosporangium sp. KLBMP 9127]